MIRQIFTIVLLLISTFAFGQEEITSTYEESIIQSRKTLLSQLVIGKKAPLDKNELNGVRFFPIDETFKFNALIVLEVNPKAVQFPTSDGKMKDYLPYARLFFRHGGHLHQLTAYQMKAHRNNPLLKDRLFVPFWDETNGEESYGGGRYLNISKKDVDAFDLVIDFNKAYNPYCAYGKGYSCPIPPVENTLHLEVRAGEMAYSKHP